MHLDRDEFVITYDSSQAGQDDLVAIVASAGYTARVATDDASEVSQSSSVDYRELLPETFARSEVEHKPVVLYFGAKWCIPCRRMADETFADQAVKSLLDRCVFEKIDADENPEISEKAGVVGLPDIRFVGSEGREMKRIPSFLGPELFADELRELLGDEPVETVTAPVSKLHDLFNDTREFRDAFNAAKGSVRVVMLVSPG